MTEQSQPQSGKGCLFWGCLTVVVVALLVAVLLGVSGFYLYRQATQPLEIPPHEFVEADYQRLQAELRGFAEEASRDEAADAVEPPLQRLDFSQDDLNTLLLGAVPQLEGKAYVRIEDEGLTFDASFPSAELKNLPGVLDGLYLNTSLHVKPRVDADGKVGLEFGRLSVNGMPVPWKTIEAPLNDYLREATGEEPVDPWSKVDEALEPFLKDARGVEVLDGRLVIEK